MFARLTVDHKFPYLSPEKLQYALTTMSYSGILVGLLVTVS